MLLPLLFTLVGLFLVVKGADWFLDGAKGIASKLGLSPALTGLVLTSFGTSLPELIVAVLASLKGNSSIVLGDVLGSNITNLSLALGLALLITPITLNWKNVWKEIPLQVAITAVFLFLSMDMVINLWDGLVILTFFMFFVAYVIEDFVFSNHHYNETKEFSAKAILMFLLGLLMLYFGGELLVNNIIKLAKDLHISTFVLSSILVAIGTSLPEIAVSVISALRGEKAISFGTIIGSNIFNLGFILAISSLIHPILVNNPLVPYTVLLIVFASLLLFTASLLNNYRIGKAVGIGLILIYSLFLYLLNSLGVILH